MKTLRKLIVFFTMIMIAGLLMFLSICNKGEFKKRDIVYYNDQLQLVKKDMVAGLDEEDIEEKYGCVIASEKEIDDPELAVLYANGAIILDIVIDDEYVGKVGWDDIKSDFEKNRRSLLKAGLILWIPLFVCGYMLFAYIYFAFIKQIDNLKEFSVVIAQGELDKPLPINRNNMFGNFVEGFDIMREQLRDSIDRERKAEIARKELIQGLSHDIKTPLAVIKATCELIEVKLLRRIESQNKRGAATEAGDNLLQGAATEAGDSMLRGRELITTYDEYADLLDKIRVISDKAGTISSIMSDVMYANLEELEKIDVNRDVTESTVVERYIENLFDYGNIYVENHIHPCLVYMDKKRMEQVIDNIIGNSEKYAGTDIKVSFSQTEGIQLNDGSEAFFIKITIRDEGPGVSADDLPLIAEKYYRGSNAADKTGYGLGMYLCKTYMDKQGGGMEYYNDNGFVVELLLRKV